MKKIVITAVFILACFHIYADSPITSTDFHEAYSDIEIVKETGAVLNKKHFDYFSSNNPIEYKVAIINKCSWNIDGKNNYSSYLNFLQKKYKQKDESILFNKCSADELLCLAYIKAMDNYFDVKKAMKVSRKALLKNQNSYTFYIIDALIHAQDAMDSDWCMVYLLVNSVRQNKGIKSDMREKAKKIIFEYMDLYKDSCKKDGE